MLNKKKKVNINVGEWKVKCGQTKTRAFLLEKRLR
jgi:hypothetical protein